MLYFCIKETTGMLACFCRKIFIGFYEGGSKGKNQDILSSLFCYLLRERSCFILAPGEEDNFAQLKKISSSHLEQRKSFCTPSSFSKMVLYPIQKPLSIKHRYMGRYHVVSGDVHNGKVIQHFQISVIFSFHY